MDLYVTLGPPASSLKALSSSDRLGRPGGLGSQLREQATAVSGSRLAVWYFTYIIQVKY
jgi:hypothetical protein